MHRSIALLGLLLLAPAALAGQTFDGALTVGHDPTGTGNLAVPYSLPAAQSAKQYNVMLRVGDSVTASLAWEDTAAGNLGGNDLDLTLLLPSAAPIPIVVSPDTVIAIAESRVARTTCTDAAAKSNAHGGGGEALGFTVPDGGEEGPYALLVRGWVMSTDQPYALSITVLSGGQDVTAARVDATPPETTLITTNPHCELL